MPEDAHEENIFLDALEWLCGKLHEQNIQYMITGGSALGFWGMIRTTMDIDVVVSVNPVQIKAFLGAIAGESYVELSMITGK